MKLLAFLVLAAAVSGCAVTGVPSGAERSVMAEDLLEGHRTSGEAMLRFTRAGSFGGAACKVRLYVDKTPVADVGSGRYVVTAISAGPVLVRASFGEKGPCPTQVSTLRLQVAPGATAGVLFDITAQGQHILQEM